MAAAPLIGDREPRAESRQLLLEAVLAAQRTLLITCGAADVRTNAPVPPAVVLDELWDCLAQTCGLTPAQTRDRIQVSHPRQAFAASNFVASGLAGPVPDGPWGFDPQARDGAAAVQGRDAAAGASPLVPEPLEAPGPAPADHDVVALDDVQQFMRKPVKEFMVRRLQLRLPTVDDEPSDDLPVELGNLERWRIGDALLEGTLADREISELVPVLRASGALPPGSIGDALVQEFETEIQVFRSTADDLQVPLRTDDVAVVDLTLPDGRRVRGSVPVHSGPRPGPLTVRFTRPKPGHRIELAVRLLALTAGLPGTTWRAVSVHRGASGSKPPTVHDIVVRGDDADERAATAAQALGTLVDLRDMGLRLPLPLFEATSQALFQGDDGRGWTEWGDETKGECADPYHRLAFGPVTFPDLMALSIAGSSPRQWADRLWGTVERAIVDTDLVAGDPEGPS